MAEPKPDPFVDELREQITGVDREIVATINRRLELVARLKRHKDEHGISFVDATREQWLIDHLSETNGGPLTEEGLRAFYLDVLALTKRELRG
jgi:chorismate mutase / prephenate dehydratase